MEPEFGKETYPYIIRGSVSWRRHVSLLNPWKHMLEKGRILTQSVETHVGEGTYPYIIRGSIRWRRDESLHNPWKHKLEEGRVLT